MHDLSRALESENNSDVKKNSLTNPDLFGQIIGLNDLGEEKEKNPKKKFSKLFGNKKTDSSKIRMSNDIDERTYLLFHQLKIKLKIDYGVNISFRDFCSYTTDAFIEKNKKLLDELGIKH